YRDRSVDHRLDADLVEDRDPLGGWKRKELEPLHIGRKELAAKIERRHAAPAAFRSVFPAADGEGAGIGLQIEILAGIPERGEVGGERQVLFGEEILVLDDAGGKRDARHG